MAWLSMAIGLLQKDIAYKKPGQVEVLEKQQLKGGMLKKGKLDQ